MSDFEVVEIGFYDILESEVVISEPSMLSVLLFGGGQDVTLAEDSFFVGNEKGIPVPKTKEEVKILLGIGNSIDWITCDNSLDTCDNSKGTCDQTFYIGNQIN